MKLPDNILDPLAAPQPQGYVYFNDGRPREGIYRYYINSVECDIDIEVWTFSGARYGYGRVREEISFSPKEIILPSRSAFYKFDNNDPYGYTKHEVDYIEKIEIHEQNY